MSRKILTLSLVIRDEEILLGMKKRGFGEGRWNGFGGKVEEGETIEEAAKRELTEEVSLMANNLDKRGELTFTFDDREDKLLVHVYRIDDFLGEPVETEEMRPAWFAFDQIPFSEMWSDDKYWFPYFLSDKKFKGAFHFDSPATSSHAGLILSQEIIKVASF